MSSGEVIETFNRTSTPLIQAFSFSDMSTPYDEHFFGKRVVFSTAVGACYVDFDAAGFVSGAKLDRPLWEY
jgi:hypothetical protein